MRGEAPLTRCPPTSRVPDVTGTRPLIVRMRVDFPEPESPTTATISPAAMSSETRFNPIVPFG